MTKIQNLREDLELHAEAFSKIQGDSKVFQAWIQPGINGGKTLFYTEELQGPGLSGYSVALLHALQAAPEAVAEIDRINGK